MWRELARFLPSLAFLALLFGGRWLHVTFNLGTIPASILEPEVPARGKPFKPYTPSPAGARQFCR